MTRAMITLAALIISWFIFAWGVGATVAMGVQGYRMVMQLYEPITPQNQNLR